jgi:hypothetical protein
MTDYTKLSRDDLLAIQYFWKVKGDLTRWAKWEEMQPALERELPDLMHAYRQMKFYGRVVNDLVNRLDTGEDSV